MWICKKCNEENEDSFDSCWKCQTFSEKGYEKSGDHQKQVETEDKEEEKNKEIETKLENELKKYRIILWPTTLFSWWVSWKILFLLTLVFLSAFSVSFNQNDYWYKVIPLFLAYFPSMFVYYSLKKYFKRKILKHLK